jgi:hypothetical protein
MNMKTGKNYKIGVFEIGAPLILIPMPNGGWVVKQNGERLGVMETDLGAWTTAEEMLEVLRFHLTLEETP